MATSTCELLYDADGTMAAYGLVYHSHGALATGQRACLFIALNGNMAAS